MQNRVSWIQMATIWGNTRHVLCCSVFQKTSRKKKPLLWCWLWNIGTNVAPWMSCFCFEFLLFSSSLHPSQQLNHTFTFQNKSNTLIQTNNLSFSSPPPSPQSSLLLLSQQGIVSPPVKIKLTIFSADIVLPVSSITSRNFNDFGLSRTLRSSRSNVIFQLTNQHRWSTLFRDYCDRLPLTSSCIPMTTQL